ncbi:glycosyltransferase family 4 protein [Roseococcus sp. YIM B11640]|uniref:glycosyltransferase family 4 protein n=1 Tax=Roseococcus sp. YIM B11640 TaxID=3133973 RepID=UPI003C7C6CD6
MIPSPYFGGAEMQTLQVARGLAAQGAEVMVAAPAEVLAGAAGRLALCESIALPLRPPEALDFTAGQRQQQAALAPLLPAWRPQAALVCCPLPTEGFGALRALGEAGVPSLAMAHLVRADWVVGPSEREMLPSLTPGWAAVSAPAARRLEALFGLAPGQVAAVPNGLPPPNARPADRERYGLPEGRLLLQVGRLDERKGADRAPEIARHIAPARVVLAGEGPLAQALRGKQGVDLLGHVPDIPAVLACADALLHISEHEGGIPLAVQEAAWAGVPILASRESLEAWDHPARQAYLVTREPADIGRVFAEAMADPEGRAARVAAARAAVEEWDEAAMIARTRWLLAAEVARCRP